MELGAPRLGEAESFADLFESAALGVVEVEDNALLKGEAAGSGGDGDGRGLGEGGGVRACWWLGLPLLCAVATAEAFALGRVAGGESGSIPAEVGLDLLGGRLATESVEQLDFGLLSLGLAGASEPGLWIDLAEVVEDGAADAGIGERGELEPASVVESIDGVEETDVAGGDQIVEEYAGGETGFDLFGDLAHQVAVSPGEGVAGSGGVGSTGATEASPENDLGEFGQGGETLTDERARGTEGLGCRGRVAVVAVGGGDELVVGELPLGHLPSADHWSCLSSVSG